MLSGTIIFELTDIIQVVGTVIYKIRVSVLLHIYAYLLRIFKF